MKIIKLFIGLIILAATPLLEHTESFDASIEKAYDVYYESVNYETPEYILKIVKGKVDNEYTYGLCFFSVNSGSHRVVISDGEKEYKLSSNSRGDVSMVAFYPIENGKVVIYDIYDKEVSLIEDYMVTPFTEEDLEDQDVLNTGAKEGYEIEDLIKNNNNKAKMIFFSVAFIIILICVFIIIVFFVKKKGKFDPETRKENVFNFKEFIETEIKENIVEAEVVSEETEEQQTKEPEPYDYGNNKRYSDDEDTGFNIKNFLSEKGYITVYKGLSEEEKNKIMLELMHLRDEKKISKDEYIMEVSELWKN